MGFWLDMVLLFQNKSNKLKSQIQKNEINKKLYAYLI